MAIVLNGTTGITNDGGYTGDGVVFADTTPANTLVTTTGGNVGIGTSSPNYKLTANGGAGPTVIQLCNTASGTTANDGFLLYQDGVDCRVQNTEAGNMLFYTGNTERARIDSSGNLLVGTTSMGNTHAYFERSSVDRAILNLGTSSTLSSLALANFRTPNGIIGSITVSSTSTAYNTSSDYRLKENIQPMTGALAKVAALKPVTYNWKSTGEGSQGFIAHELAEVVPDCVMGEKDAVDAEGNPVYQGIDTSFLVATLTAAIQEQQAIITALTARVAALDARLTSLEGTQP